MLWRAVLLLEFFLTKTISMCGKRRDSWGSTSRGGQKKARLCSGGTGCFSQRVGSLRGPVGAVKGDRQCRAVQGGSQSACVEMELELARSKRNAFCLYKAPSVLFPGNGRAAKDLNPFQSLVLLGGWALIPITVPWVHWALDPPVHVEVGLWQAACWVENWGLSPNILLAEPSAGLTSCPSSSGRCVLHPRCVKPTSYKDALRRRIVCFCGGEMSVITWQAAEEKQHCVTSSGREVCWPCTS